MKWIYTNRGVINLDNIVSLYCSDRDELHPTINAITVSGRDIVFATYDSQDKRDAEFDNLPIW